MSALATLPASGATSGSVVGATVLSATSIDVQCDANSAWNLGPLAVGVNAMTATNANACRVGFGSSNDLATLRLFQPDGTGSAMNQIGGHTDLTYQHGIFDVAVKPAGNAVAVGFRGMYAYATSGTNWVLADSGGAASAGLASVDYAAGNTFVAVGLNGRVRISTDNGQTFGASTFPTTEHLNGVDAFDGTKWIAVGTNGAVVYSTNGSSWNVGASGVGVNLDDVTMTSTVDGYAVGDSGTVLRTGNGGSTWTPVAIPTAADLDAVDVAPDGTILVGGEGVIFRSITGGASWTVPTGVPVGTVEDIVAGTDSSAHLVMSSASPVILRSTTGGASWTAVTRAGTARDLHGVDSLDGSVVVYGGDGYTAGRATDALTFAVDTLGWEYARDLAVWNDGRIVTVGDYGQIRRSTNDGGAWTTQSITAQTSQLRAVAFSPEDRANGIAVGASGVVLTTSDGGTTWTARTSGTAQSLHDVVFTTGDTAWTVGDAGIALRSNDRGATWSTISLGAGAPTLQGIDSPSPSTIWITGSPSVLLRSTDFGATWSARPTPAAGLDLRGVVAFDANRVVVHNASLVYRTFNAGTAWTNHDPLLSTASALDVDALDMQTFAIAATGQRYRQSKDGGATWDISQNGNGPDNTSVATLDANRVYTAGSGVTRRLGINPVTDWNGTTATWTSAATGMFGGCLQALAGATQQTWPIDTTGTTPGICETDNADPWQAIPQASTAVGRTSSIGVPGTATFVWGFKPGPSQAPGSYVASVGFEVLAP